MQSVPITVNAGEFECHSGEVYSIQHYVIKFVNDLRQVGGFFWVLRFPSPIKLTATKVALNIINPPLIKEVVLDSPHVYTCHDIDYLM